MLKKTLVFIALFSVAALMPQAALPDTLTPVLDAKGNAPRCHITELPQEAVKIFKDTSPGGKLTVVLMSASLALSPLSDGDFAKADALFKKGDWEGLLGKNYPTAVVYPVTPDNYLWFAAREGLIDEIHWIAPAKESVGSEPIGNFRNYLKGLGLPDKVLKSLKQRKKSIYGDIGGVTVRVYSVKDIPEIKKEAILLADPGFFQPLYKNEVKTPLLDLFGEVMHALGSSGLKVSDAVISYFNSASPLTVKNRFIARYLYAYFKDPKKFKDGPPDTWDLRSQAMYLETFFQPDDVAQSYADAIKLDPDDPSLHYDMAQAMMSQQDLDGIRQEMSRAVALDKGYYPAYLDLAAYFISQRMPEDAEYFAREAAKLNPQDPRCWDALYSSLAAQKKYKEAAEAVDKKIALGFDDAGTLSSKADALLKASPSPRKSP